MEPAPGCKTYGINVSSKPAPGNLIPASRETTQQKVKAWLKIHPESHNPDSCDHHRHHYDPDDDNNSNTASHNAVSQGEETSASTRSSCNTRKAYKLNRSAARAQARPARRGADDDSGDDHDLDETRHPSYVAHADTRNVLKQIAALSKTQRRDLIAALMSMDK